MNYPYVKCLHPRAIHNPYNHEDMLVPCNQCEACVQRKSALNTLKLRAECEGFLHHRFITLTYDETYVPRMYLYEHNEAEIEATGYYFSLLDPDDCSEPLGYWDDRSTYNLLCRKCNSYDVPFLRKSDFQLFMKRLRKWFSDSSKKNNKNYGQIRYYCCGEYGPKHFRPHLHIVLFSNSDELIEDLGEAVSACWRFGRFSVEKPYCDVTSYVAQYVNSSVPLPSLLKLPKTRPFSCHSVRLGESFFQTTKEQIYSSSYEEIVRRSMFVSNDYQDVSMWRSLKTYYFPRCKGYDTLSSSERYGIYTIHSQLLLRFSGYYEGTVSSLTDAVLRHLSNEVEYYGSFIDPMSKYLVDLIGTDWTISVLPEVYDVAWRSLYMILRTSNHFEQFVCDGNLSEFNIRSKLKIIEQFWLDDELANMNRRYRSIEEDTEEQFENEDEYLLIYEREYPERIEKTIRYRKWKMEVIKNYRNSMKHKIQNDKNRVFEKY